MFATCWWFPLHQMLSVPALEKTVVPSCQKVYGPLHLGRKSLAGLSRTQHGKPVSGVMPQTHPRVLAPETLGFGDLGWDCYPHCCPGRVGVDSVLRRLLMSSSSVCGRLRSPWSVVRWSSVRSIPRLVTKVSTAMGIGKSLLSSTSRLSGIGVWVTFMYWSDNCLSLFCPSVNSPACLEAWQHTVI